MKLSKRQLKRIIKETMDQSDEIIHEEESDSLFITQYGDGAVQIESKQNNNELVVFSSAEIAQIIAALKMMQQVEF